MINPIIEQQILDELNRLDLPQQQRVLDFARELSHPSRPQGVPAEQVIRAAAVCSTRQEVADMMQAIEEDCEKIDLDEW